MENTTSLAYNSCDTFLTPIKPTKFQPNNGSEETSSAKSVSSIMTCYKEKMQDNISGVLIDSSSQTIKIIYNGYILSLNSITGEVQSIHKLKLDLESA
jgi:hypothetical protein